jgi:Fe-S-cluster-containing hydrogenase component 2
MLRKIIEIDEEKCDGCELCISACPEGAIRMVDGKAHLVKDFYCDGLGACLGHCPQGAITVIEREADEYDERAVMQRIIEQGDDVIRQHLAHLRESEKHDLLEQAEQILDEYKNKKAGLTVLNEHTSTSGCPGSQSISFAPVPNPELINESDMSALTHWPIQMHLISPHAPHYRGSHLLLVADCVAFSVVNFQSKFLHGKTLAIACPKLDHRQEVYLEKLKTLIDESGIQSISVVVMQVPCCAGLVQLAQTAVQHSKKKIPLKTTIIGIDGAVLKELDLN